MTAEPLTPEEEAADEAVADGKAALDALRATDVPSDMTTCVECFRPVAEVDAETGECRECFARAALATPEPDRPPCGLFPDIPTRPTCFGVACCDCIGYALATPEPDA